MPQNSRAQSSGISWIVAEIGAFHWALLATKVVGGPCSPSCIRVFPEKVNYMRSSFKLLDKTTEWPSKVSHFCEVV